jgi:ATP-dependent helicase/nuclease subunit A
LARTAIQSKLNAEMLSEELRVLYVAMTRAKEKLIITATLRSTERTKEKLSLIPEGIAAPQAVLALRSMIEWVLVGIRGIDDATLSVKYLDSSDIEYSYDSKPADESNNYCDLGRDASSDISDINISAAIDEEKESNFSYIYKAAVDLPSKLTVTGLKTLLDPEAETAPWVQVPPETEFKAMSALYPSPSFISGKREMTAAERGTLLHLIMQHIDYKSCSHEHGDKSIEKELQRLNNLGIITDEQVINVDKDKIAKFLSSTLGSRMTSAVKLDREFKFSILRSAGDYFPCGGTDKILLQGVVDCYFEEDSEIVLVDFKTDRVTEKTVDKIAHKYVPQLNAYADALHHITGKCVKERIIYFFSLNREYTL